MPSAKVIDLTKRGPGTGEGIEIDFAKILTHPRTGLQTAEIASVDDILLERKTSAKGDPEVWEDVTSGVTFSAGVVGDGALTNSAVTFVCQLDEDNDPPAGKEHEYQIVVKVVLDNGQGEAGFAPARIWPSAAVPSF